MLIHKFGGTSVGNAQRIAHAAAIIEQNSRPAIVVTSAMAGVTDKLISLAHAAKNRKTSQVEALLSEIRLLHLESAENIAEAGLSREKLVEQLRELLLELEQLLHGVRLLQELTPRSLDLLQSFGERLAVLLLTESLKNRGIDAVPIDSRQIIRTNDRFGYAHVELDTSRTLTRTHLLEISQTKVPVVTGFIGQTEDGLTTTLGRGGSDYTAALLGSFLDAEEICIWTDVDGVMTADPRIVPEARVLEVISYREAAEMAYFGSKVIHPTTMTPAVQENIPIRIRNSFNTDRKGTLISDFSHREYRGVKNVTSISEMALVTIEGRGMIGLSGVVGRVFTTTNQARINVYMISQASSEQNLSFLVQKEEGQKAQDVLEKEFRLELSERHIDRIHVKNPVGILAIIGEGMIGTPGISQRLFSAMGRAHINVLAIAQGSSELNLSIVVDQKDLKRAVGAAHSEFRLTPTTHVFLLGRGLIGKTLIKQILESRSRLSDDLGVSLNFIGVSGREEWLFDPSGIQRETLEKIVDGESLISLGGEERPSDKTLLEHIAQSQFLDVILADVTAADTTQLHLDALEKGIHVVTANKRTLSGPLQLYKQLRNNAFSQGLGYLFETTFGAGLPVLFTLQELLATHDTILRITGCFSGTLGFICSGIQEGRPFSEVVREAKLRGYTEPDPREDLSGRDVAKKALIIAREIGLELEMDAIALHCMVPPEFMAIENPNTFLERLGELDEEYSKKVENARKDNKVLRYLAQISPQNVSVSLEAVDLSSPLAQIAGPDNILVYETERYKDTPLVIRGPGAGAEVTAAGVFGDLLKIARRI